MRANFTQVKARQGRSLGLCMGDGVNRKSVTFYIQKFNSTHHTNIYSKGTSEPEKIKLSDGVIRSWNGAVAAKLCQGGAYWPPLPKEGVTQLWGRPVVGGESCVLVIYLSKAQSAGGGGKWSLPDPDCFPSNLLRVAWGSTMVHFLVLLLGPPVGAP